MKPMLYQAYRGFDSTICFALIGATPGSRKYRKLLLNYIPSRATCWEVACLCAPATRNSLIEIGVSPDSIDDLLNLSLSFAKRFVGEHPELRLHEDTLIAYIMLAEIDTISISSGTDWLRATVREHDPKDDLAESHIRTGVEWAKDSIGAAGVWKARIDIVSMELGEHAASDPYLQDYEDQWKNDIAELEGVLNEARPLLSQYGHGDDPDLFPPPG